MTKTARLEWVALFAWFSAMNFATMISNSTSAWNLVSMLVSAILAALAGHELSEWIEQQKDGEER